MHSLFVLTDDGVQVAEGDADYEYFVMSSNYRNRYSNEPHRYADIIAIYEEIDETYDTLLKVIGSNPRHSVNEMVNICYQLDYLLNGGDIIGDDIWIYELTSD